MTDQYMTEVVGDEDTSACVCCGRSVYEGIGWLLRGDDEIACYLYRWAEGHEVAFSLAVAGTKDGYMRPGFVSVSCRQKDGDLSYSVTEPTDSAAYPQGARSRRHRERHVALVVHGAAHLQLLARVRSPGRSSHFQRVLQNIGQRSRILLQDRRAAWEPGRDRHRRR